MSGSRREAPRRGAIAVAGIAAVSSTLLAACVSGVDTTPPTSDAPAVSASPDDDPTRFDWVAIVTELDQRRDDAQRDRSIEAIDTFCAPSSVCHERWSDSIGALIDDDLRIVAGRPDEIVDVTYAGTLDGSPLSEAFEVALDVERRATEQGLVQLVNGDGAVEQEFRPDDDTPPGTTISEWLVFETR